MKQIASDDDGGFDNDFKLTVGAKKDDVYYIKACWYDSNSSGDITVYCEENDMYDISNYDIDHNSRLYLLNNKIINPFFVKFSLSAGKVNVSYTTSYRVEGDEDSPWKMGIPNSAGYYEIKIEGTSPYKGGEGFYLRIVDISEIKSAELINERIKYTGKPLSFSDVVIGYEDYNEEKGEDEINYQLKYGTDYKYEGYCTTEVYNSTTPNSIKWNTQMPSAVGSYYLKLSGVGDFKGTGYFRVDIYRHIDPDGIIATQLKSTSASGKLENLNEYFYEIKPSVSGEYTFEFAYNSKIEDGSGYGANLYDNNGLFITLDKNYGDKNYYFKFTTKLTAGMSYYLAVGQYDEEDYNNEMPYSFKITGKGVTYSWYTAPAPAPEKSKPLSKGTEFVVGKFRYKVTKSADNASEVTLVKNLNSKIKNASIGATVKYKDVTYKITAIGANAFKNNKKLTKVTIGANVSSIGKNAFAGCIKLKTIIIKSKVIKKVGAGAFNKIAKKYSVKVPKGKKNAYGKIFKKGKISAKKIK
ncbi:MAG: leucine-rich repeat domain-containing protein [Eubacterium sp.]|nr:leucine-rich repeat domain-containing protein [Eubacterium sp.]